MSWYIFRMPRDTPALTWEALDRYIERGRDKYRRKIGTTVTVERQGPQEITVQLYCTTIAVLSRDGRVHFTENGASDRHIATGSWLGKVAADNKLGYIWQENWVRYLYGTGNKRPIAGQCFGNPAKEN